MSEKCNSCGAEIEYAAGSQSLKCPYCGAVNEIQKAEDQLPDAVEKIIPLTVSQDDLEKRVYGYMASGTYTPDDMLEAATFTKQECFYVPAFLFRVKYEATWTASFGYDRTEHYTVYETQSLGTDSRGHSRGTHQVPVTKTKTVTDWRPQNGVDSGVFPVSTYAGKKLSESGLAPAELVPYAISKGSITDFNPSFMKGVESENFSVSKSSALATLDSEICSNIDVRVKNHGQGDHQKDWHWNAKKSYSTSTLYVPICHAVYDYEGIEYHVWIDGIGDDGIRADKLPEDKGRKKLVYLGFVPVGVGIATLIITSFIGPFNSGGLVVAAIFGGYAAMRRKSIIEYSKNIRDSLLTQIHASSNTIKEMGDEEQAKVARAFHRPEKPFFAKTHHDKFVLPSLTLLALAGVIMANTSNSEKAPQAATLAPKSEMAAPTPIVAPESTPPVIVKTDTASAVEAVSSVPASVVISSAVAEWVKVGGSKDGEITVYANPATIRKAGNKATMWEMDDSKSVQINTVSGKPYLSHKNQYEFDCKEKQWRMLYVYSFHSGNMGSGEVTHTSSASSTVPGEMGQISPGSAMEDMWKIACEQK